MVGRLRKSNHQLPRTANPQRFGSLFRGEKDVTVSEKPDFLRIRKKSKQQFVNDGDARNHPGKKLFRLVA
jgi:hypothetical protein